MDQAFGSMGWGIRPLCCWQAGSWQKNSALPNLNWQRRSVNQLFSAIELTQLLNNTMMF
jgi:hypothetical protein